MKRRQIYSYSRRNHRAWLYSVVYTSKLSVFAVLLLFASFLIQPLHKAIAAEDVAPVPEIETPVAESVREQVEEEVTEQNIPEELEQNSEIEEVIEVETVVEDSEPEIPEESEVLIDTNEDTSLDNLSTTTEPVDNISTSSQETVSSGEGDSSNGETISQEEITTEPEPESNVDTSQSTTSSSEVTEETEIPVVQAESLISEENFYQFSKQSCVAVGDGTYHCSSSEFTEYDSRSVVFADLGESKNMEIFLKTAKGETRQITDNNYDDTAPYYDAETLQIVWQRLVDGRYQIILYDIVEDEESQLTFSRTNNMEPKVSADGVVWQAWDNNDWEIMFFDGSFTDQITDNDAQDVAPTIQDKYILWTVIGKSTQEAKVYSLASQEILTISGYDGGVIENPRFVLVYDTKFDNGDVITQGFDPTTGISEPIAAKPAEDPIDIPLPDPIGEIRALIQTKSSFEDEIDQGQIQSSGSSTASSTPPDTLDLKGDVDMSPTTTPIIGGDVFELTEFDLILTETNIDFEALVDEDIDEIDDLIIEEIENTQ